MPKKLSMPMPSFLTDINIARIGALLLVIVLTVVIAMWFNSTAKTTKTKEHFEFNPEQHFKRTFVDENNKRIDQKTSEDTEQLQAAKYVAPTDAVLELGARYGTVTAVILDQLLDKKQMVAVDPDPDIIPILHQNLKNAGYGDVNIEKAVVGKTPLQMHQYGYASVAETSCRDTNGCITVPNITYPELQAKYNIKFNTIIADCEGCFLDLIKHIQETQPDLQPIKKIIFEADYPDKTDYAQLTRILIDLGFSKVDPNDFCQVWIRN